MEFQHFRIWFGLSWNTISIQWKWNFHISSDKVWTCMTATYVNVASQHDHTHVCTRNWPYVCVHTKYIEALLQLCWRKEFSSTDCFSETNMLEQSSNWTKLRLVYVETLFQLNWSKASIYVEVSLPLNRTCSDFVWTKSISDWHTFDMFRQSLNKCQTNLRSFRSGLAKKQVFYVEHITCERKNKYF